MEIYNFKEGKIWEHNGKVAVMIDKRLMLYIVDITNIYESLPFSSTMNMLHYYLNHAMPTTVLTIRKEPDLARIKRELSKI